MPTRKQTPVSAAVQETLPTITLGHHMLIQKVMCLSKDQWWFVISAETSLEISY